MNYSVQEEHRQKMLQKLRTSSSIDFSELLVIVDAFQIASGQSFAAGNTKGMLDFLKEGNTITVMNFNRTTDTTILKSASDLAEAIRKIDQYVDLASDDHFREYFG